MAIAERSGVGSTKRTMGGACRRHDDHSAPRADLVGSSVGVSHTQVVEMDRVSPVQGLDLDSHLGRAKLEWEATVDSLPQVICVLDSNGKIVRANRTVERWYLGDVTRVRGMTVDQLLHGKCTDEHCHLKTFMRDAAEAAQRGQRIRCRVQDAVLNRPLEISLMGFAPVLRGIGDFAVFVAEDVSAIDRTESALRHSESELRLLSAQLLTAQEMERKRISSELHDSVGASLAAIKLMLEQTTESMARGDRQTGTATLEYLAQKIGETVGEVRRISMDLRPATLDDLGLLPTLSWFFREFSQIHPHIEVVKDVDVVESEVPPALRITIFRIVQEAVSNVVKHAETNRILFQLKRNGRDFKLVIEDWGRGFDPAVTLVAGETGRRGVGLCSMRERVDLSGGQFSLHTRPGAGTRIRAIWPLPTIAVR